MTIPPTVLMPPGFKPRIRSERDADKVAHLARMENEPAYRANYRAWLTGSRPESSASPTPPKATATTAPAVKQWCNMSATERDAWTKQQIAEQKTRDAAALAAKDAEITALKSPAGRTAAWQAAGRHKFIGGTSTRIPRQPQPA